MSPGRFLQVPTGCQMSLVAPGGTHLVSGAPPGPAANLDAFFSEETRKHFSIVMTGNSAEASSDRLGSPSMIDILVRACILDNDSFERFLPERWDFGLVV